MATQNVINRAYNTVPTATTIASWDANKNMSAVGFIAAYTTTVTASQTTTLTVGSNQQQYFTGSTAGQIVQMPVTSTLVLGQSWMIVNNSSVAITINSSGSNLILTLPAASETTVTCILTSGTTAASWATTPAVSGSGTVNSGLQYNLAYYATAGTAVSGLANGGSSGLALLSGSPPIWSTGKPITQVIVQNFYTNGTYTPTTGMQYCDVQVVGAGGGGGGSATSGAPTAAAAGGGGGGGYARKVFTAATIGASQAVTVSVAGGAGGVAGNTTGTAGGTSSLGALISATGGNGGLGGAAGAAGASAGGTGGAGTATSPGFATSGAPGSASFTSALNVMGGAGGSSFFGGGAIAIAGAVGAGNNAPSYGGGGGGAVTAAGSTQVAGGNGGPGLIVITEYVSV